MANVTEMRERIEVLQAGIAAGMTPAEEAMANTEIKQLEGKIAALGDLETKRRGSPFVRKLIMAAVVLALVILFVWFSSTNAGLSEMGSLGRGGNPKLTITTTTTAWRDLREEALRAELKMWETYKEYKPHAGTMDTRGMSAWLNAIVEYGVLLYTNEWARQAIYDQHMDAYASAGKVYFKDSVVDEAITRIMTDIYRP